VKWQIKSNIVSSANAAKHGVQTGSMMLHPQTLDAVILDRRVLN
jgi:hypothetical protein